MVPFWNGLWGSLAVKVLFVIVIVEYSIAFIFKSLLDDNVSAMPPPL